MGERLSAVVVAYNEAHFLGGCLKRLAFCDEILVIDLGSSDGSVEIATEQGVRVIQHEWVPFAEKVRGFALEHVTSDWILFVDPDLYIPRSLGEKLKELIDIYTEQGLGMVFLPLFTYFGDKPLRFGQKGGRRGYKGVLHRKRVEISELLHFQGVRLLGDHFALGLVARDEEVVSHYWIARISDAIVKAKRYLPYEPERRQALGQSFSWGRLVYELVRSLKRDLEKWSILEWRSTQVMFFQLWYTWKANIALRVHDQA